MKQVYKDFRSTIWVAMVAFIVCWASNHWLYSDNHRNADPDAWLKQQLKVTDAQYKALQPIEAQYTEQRKALEIKIAEANTELANALTQDKRYSDRVKKASQRVNQLQAELKDAALQHFYAMQPALTPKQVARMNELVIHALSHHP